MSLIMFIREEWIKNTQFYQDSSSEILSKILIKVKACIDQKKNPIVVFDLDSTLFDVSKRSYEILRKWLTHPETQSFTPTLNALSNLKPEDFRYSLEELWDDKKISMIQTPFDHHFKHAKQFWRKRFFGHDYLKHDAPTAGAVEFVKQLYELGAQIVYLTGRDTPQMAFGTFDQLKRHQLPIEVPRSRLILKPKRHLNDIEFKSQAAATIRSWGEVIATFENEPKNLVAMSQAFLPETMNVFIETVSSDHPAPAGKSIYKIREFK